jgi:AraC-like DNA-binding protein
MQRATTEARARPGNAVPDVVPMPALLLDRFARQGIDTERLLQRAEIPRSRFAAPQPQGTTAELFALWRAAGEVGTGHDLGLRVGTDTLAHHQSVAHLAALHSPTLGEGLAKLARYKRLVCPEEITIDVRRGEARIRFEWLLAGEDPPAPLIDAIFAGVMSLVRSGTGKPIAPRRLEMTRRRAHEATLRSHFGCDIRFDAPFDLFVLDESALALPLVTQNAQVLAVLVPGLESALEKGGASRSLADDVRAALGQKICGERPAVEKVAKALGLSPRTLQRRLGELGTTYQKLLDEVRHRSARRLLARTDLAAGEVAFLLGFEELNSFTRAFHSWEGTTPSRWRARSHP